MICFADLLMAINGVIQFGEDADVKDRYPEELESEGPMDFGDE